METLSTNRISLDKLTNGAPLYAKSLGGSYSVPVGLNLPDDTNEVRFEIEHHGPWQLVSRVRGLCVSMDMQETDYGQRITAGFYVHGVRAMSDIKESGYQLEGRVAVNGRKRSAFTGSILFERADGSLLEVACLIARND